VHFVEALRRSVTAVLLVAVSNTMERHDDIDQGFSRVGSRFLLLIVIRAINGPQGLDGIEQLVEHLLALERDVPCKRCGQLGPELACRAGVDVIVSVVIVSGYHL